MNNNSGNLYVFSAPSGAGKTSLVKALTENIDQLEMSVSCTTRPMRVGEVENTDYQFISGDEFECLKSQGVFLEYAKVFNHYYGTSKQWVDQMLAKDIDVILEIDWQGARLIRQQIPDAVCVFILPPSKEVLHDRLMKRQQDSSKIIDERMQKAIDEMSHYNEFDYLIINDNFDTALSELSALIMTMRKKIVTQTYKHSTLLSTLLQRR